MIDNIVVDVSGLQLAYQEIQKRIKEAQTQLSTCQKCLRFIIKGSNQQQINYWFKMFEILDIKKQELTSKAKSFRNYITRTLEHIYNSITRQITMLKDSIHFEFQMQDLYRSIQLIRKKNTCEFINNWQVGEMIPVANKVEKREQFDKFVFQWPSIQNIIPINKQTPILVSSNSLIIPNQNPLIYQNYPLLFVYENKNLHIYLYDQNMEQFLIIKELENFAVDGWKLRKINGIIKGRWQWEIIQNTKIVLNGIQYKISDYFISHKQIQNNSLIICSDQTIKVFNINDMQQKFSFYVGHQPFAMLNQHTVIIKDKIVDLQDGKEIEIKVPIDKIKVIKVDKIKQRIWFGGSGQHNLYYLQLKSKQQK